MVNGLWEESCELLVVEDLEAAARGNLADGCRVKPEHMTGWQRFLSFIKILKCFKTNYKINNILKYSSVSPSTKPRPTLEQLCFPPREMWLVTQPNRWKSLDGKTQTFPSVWLCYQENRARWTSSNFFVLNLLNELDVIGHWTFSYFWSTHDGSCSFWTEQIWRYLTDTPHTPLLQHSKGGLLW